MYRGISFFYISSLIAVFHLLNGCGFAMMKEKHIDQSSNASEAVTDPVTQLTLTRLSPTKVQTNDTTPTIRISGLSASDVVRLYSDINCSTLLTTATATGSSLDVTLPAYASEGRHSIYAQKTTSGGTVSDCTIAQFYYDIDTTQPVFTGTITVTEPLSGLNYSLTPTITATGLATGAAGPPTSENLSIYTDSACTQLVNFTRTTSGGNSALQFSIGSSEYGLHAYYYKIIDSAGNSTNCSATPVNYYYRAWMQPTSSSYCGQPSSSGVPRGQVVKLNNGLKIIGNPFDDNSTAITDCNTDDGSLPRSGNVLLYFPYTQTLLKAPNAGSDDLFGYAVAASGDTVVVGAPCESSDATTIATDTSGQNNNKSCSGAVYVYINSGTTSSPNWVLQAFIKASNSEADDRFGSSVEIDGDTLVVGAINEDSSDSTISNSATSSADNSVTDSGAVYVYQRSGQTWTQQAYIKAKNVQSNHLFGYSLALANNTLIVGAPKDDAHQLTVTNGTTASSDTTATDSGAAFIYIRTGTSWAQQAYIKAPNGTSGDQFGISVDVDGDRIVIGAPYEDNKPTGIVNSSSFSYDQPHSANYADTGSAYVFLRTASNWSFESYLKPNITNGSNGVFWTFNFQFGQHVVIEDNKILVTAPGSDIAGSLTYNSSAAGIGSLDYATAPTQAEYGALYIFQKAENNQWAGVGFIGGGGTAVTASLFWADLDANQIIFGKKAISNTYFAHESWAVMDLAGMIKAKISSGMPQPKNNLSALNIYIFPYFTSAYKYKIGLAGSTDCTAATGYSGAWIDASIPITDNLSGFSNSDEVRLCVIGRVGAQNEQMMSEATQVDWVVDTSL